MLVIFVLYTTSITLFTHVHVIDGVSIVHSHFYEFWDDDTSEVGILKVIIDYFQTSDIGDSQFSNRESFHKDVFTNADSSTEKGLTGAPVQDHQHSSDQLILFEMLSHFRKVGLPLLLFSFVSIIILVRTELVDYIACYVVRPFLISYSLRGPPRSFLY